jgi:hypothetical protein
MHDLMLGSESWDCGVRILMRRKVNPRRWEIRGGKEVGDARF